MKRKSMGFAAALAVSFAFMSPAASQVTDYNDIAFACSTGGDCEALVASAIDQLRAAGFTGEALEEQLGLLAGTLVDGSDGLALVHRYNIAGGLRVLAQASNDTVQTGSIATLANRLERGTGRSNLSIGAFGSASEA